MFHVVNIPFNNYAGFQAWVEPVDNPHTPYWIELYTTERDYKMAFDTKEKWIKVLSLINELSILSK